MGRTSAKTRRQYYHKNRDKCRAQQRANYARNKEARQARQREYHRRPGVLERAKLKKYGLTPADYNAMFTAQGGVCAICKQPETAVRKGKILSLAVDHCHDTDKVRGLLCACCNIAIGQLKHDPLRLRVAAEYLERAGG